MDRFGRVEVFFLGYVVGAVTALLVACAPAAKIGTGLDCWPDCREEERDAE